MSENQILNKVGRVGLNVRGEFDAAVQYEELDVVIFDGSAFVAKQATPATGNIEPAEDNEQWMMLAKGNPLRSVSYQDTLPTSGVRGQIVLVPSA